MLNPRRAHDAYAVPPPNPPPLPVAEDGWMPSLESGGAAPAAPAPPGGLSVGGEAAAAGAAVLLPTGERKQQRSLQDVVDAHYGRSRTGAASAIPPHSLLAVLYDALPHTMPLELVRVSVAYVGTLRIIAGMSDGQVVLYDPIKRHVSGRLSGHTSAVYALTMLRDGRLATASVDGTVRLWVTGLRTCVASAKRHTNSVYSLATLHGNNGALISGSADNSIRLYAVSDTPYDVSEQTDFGLDCRTIREHTNTVTALAAVPVGGGFPATTFCGHGAFVSGAMDGSIKLWNTDTWVMPRCVMEYEGAPSGITALAVLQTGNEFVCGCSDGTLHIWCFAQPDKPVWSHTMTSGLAVSAISVPHPTVLPHNDGRELSFFAAACGNKWELWADYADPQRATALSLAADDRASAAMSAAQRAAQEQAEADRRARQLASVAALVPAAAAAAAAAVANTRRRSYGDDEGGTTAAALTTVPLQTTPPPPGGNNWYLDPHDTALLPPAWRHIWHDEQKRAYSGAESGSSITSRLPTLAEAADAVAAAAVRGDRAAAHELHTYQLKPIGGGTIDGRLREILLDAHRVAAADPNAVPAEWMALWNDEQTVAVRVAETVPEPQPTTLEQAARCIVAIITRGGPNAAAASQERARYSADTATTTTTPGGADGSAMVLSFPGFSGGGGARRAHWKTRISPAVYAARANALRAAENRVKDDILAAAAAKEAGSGASSGAAAAGAGAGAAATAQPVRTPWTHGSGTLPGSERAWYSRAASAVASSSSSAYYFAHYYGQPLAHATTTRRPVCAGVVPRPEYTSRLSGDATTVSGLPCNILSLSWLPNRQLVTATADCAHLWTVWRDDIQPLASAAAAAAAPAAAADTTVLGMPFIPVPRHRTLSAAHIYDFAAPTAVIEPDGAALHMRRSEAEEREHERELAAARAAGAQLPPWMARYTVTSAAPSTLGNISSNALKAWQAPRIESLSVVYDF